MDVGEIVENQRVVFVEFGNGGLQRQRQGLAGDLQPLHQIGGAGEQHAEAVLDHGMAKACAKMRHARPRWSETQDMAAFLEPAIIGGQRHDMRAADHRHGVEVEAVEGFPVQQSRIGQMPLDAPARPVGQRRWRNCSLSLPQAAYRVS